VAIEPTDEQRAILDFVAGGKGNLVVEALAGSGKSWTALKALEVIPQKSILMAAFNRPVADNLQAKIKMMRVPRTHAVHAKTFHSLGLAMIKASYPHLEIDKDSATESLVAKVCTGRSISFKNKRYIMRLLRLLKETTIKLEPTAEEVLEIATDHEIFGAKTTDSDIEETIDRALAAYELSRDIKNLTAIDFCDMTWLPVICNLPPASRYQAIIVDELQDISEPQFALVQHVMLPATRLIAIGDLRQAIYSWRGGMGERAWAIMREHFKAETLRLTTTFRCSKLVVEQANGVLGINGADHALLKALPDANDGSITSIKLADLPSEFVGGSSDVVHTFVLSRRNDTLLDCALFLHRNKTNFQLVGGKDLLAPLFELLDYKLDLGSHEAFRKSLVKWRAEQLARAEKLDSPTLADRVQEQYTMLESSLGAAGRPTLIKGLLAAILADNKTGVWLSTVHKVKGLEAQRVFLLRQSFARHQASNAGNDPRAATEQDVWMAMPPQEELNIEYVAITRAKEHLVWVDMDHKHDGDIKVTEAIKGLEALGDDMLKKLTTAELEIMFARAEREGQRLDGIDLEAAKHWTAYAGKLLTELTARSKAAK
jgi:superfamily I DNA/RNA helicase